MASTMIEEAVLSRQSIEDAFVALERLAAVGSLVLLRGLRSAAYSATVSTDPDQILSEAMAERDGTAIEASRSQGSRKLDPRAIARLESAREEHHADWLIATEGTLASARVCQGLRVICLGPGDDQFDPTRPDYRARSLLDAARFIETSAAFA
jgi:hypothetical protein